jgi:small subunit ribosomal protein S17
MPKKVITTTADKKTPMHKTLVGVIVSDKMQETAVVEVAVWRVHRILKKRYMRHNRFMAHNAGNEFKMGDNVEITQTRPLSRNKSWAITRKVDLATKPKTKK